MTRPACRTGSPIVPGVSVSATSCRLEQPGQDRSTNGARTVGRRRRRTDHAVGTGSRMGRCPAMSRCCAGSTSAATRRWPWPTCARWSAGLGHDDVSHLHPERQRRVQHGADGQRRAGGRPSSARWPASWAWSPGSSCCPAPSWLRWPGTTRTPASRIRGPCTSSSWPAEPVAGDGRQPGRGAGRRWRGRAAGTRRSTPGRALFLHTPDGFGRSELAVQLGRGRGPMSARGAGTARNWATVTKLLALCDAPG